MWVRDLGWKRGGEKGEKDLGWKRGSRECGLGTWVRRGGVGNVG